MSCGRRPSGRWTDLHVKAGRPATARHRLGGLNRLYKGLAGVDAAATNPVASIEQPAPPRPRSNVLAAESVKLLWDGAERFVQHREGTIFDWRSYSRFAGRSLPTSRSATSSLSTVRLSELRLDGDEGQERPHLIMPLVGSAWCHRPKASRTGFLPQRPSHSAYPRQAVLGVEKTSRADRKGDRDRVCHGTICDETFASESGRTRGRDLSRQSTAC